MMASHNDERQLSMSVTIATGAGYGPVSYTFRSLTIEGLRASADADGDVRFFAYAPNAGHPLDEYHEECVDEHLGEHVSWGRERNPLTPIRYAYVSADDDEGLRLALDMLTVWQDSPYWDEDTWLQREHDEAVAIVDRALSEYGTDDKQSAWVVAMIAESPEPYYTDNVGTHVPFLDDVMAQLDDETVWVNGTHVDEWAEYARTYLDIPGQGVLV